MGDREAFGRCEPPARLCALPAPAHGAAQGDGPGTALRALQPAAALEVSPGRHPPSYRCGSGGTGGPARPVPHMGAGVRGALGRQEAPERPPALGAVSSSVQCGQQHQPPRGWMPWAPPQPSLHRPHIWFLLPLLLPGAFPGSGAADTGTFSLRGRPSTNGGQELGHKQWLPHSPPHTRPCGCSRLPEGPIGMEPGNLLIKEPPRPIPESPACGSHPPTPEDK